MVGPKPRGGSNLRNSEYALNKKTRVQRFRGTKRRGGRHNPELGGSLPAEGGEVKMPPAGESLRERRGKKPNGGLTVWGGDNWKSSRIKGIKFENRGLT